MIPASWVAWAAVGGVAVLAVAGWRQWLTASGIVAATAVGGAIGWGLGLPGLALLVFFFVTSSALTRMAGGRRVAGTPGQVEGGRNAGQVFANAGAAVVAALAVPWIADAGVAIVACGGALAAATSDTWASEVGEWRGGVTRLITTWARVDPGVDGGVSWPGSLAAVAASLAVGGLAGWLFGDRGIVLPIATGGMAGMLVDSLTGATIEGRVRRVGNETVNLFGTTAGAAVAIILG